MGVKRSGMNSIDALLKGTYWSKKAGKPLVLTYSIDQSGKGKLSSRQDDNEVAMVQEALKQWERVANIDFRQVSKGGNLRFSGQNGGAGKASSKTDWKWWNPGSWGTKKLKQVNITLGKSNASGKGGRLLAQAIHEIGHALGLKHPGNYNGDKQDKSPFLPYSQDNNTNTVMSYNEVGNQEATPMAYDIRAIQYLYGAKTFNSGNTRYRFDSVHGYTNGYYGYQGDKYKRMKLSLWDSAGRDILDFSKLATNSKGYHFDINEGGILTKKDALNSWWYRPRDNSKKGNFDSNKKWTTPYGTTIAYGTAIEDVIGSASHDRIIGNSASNYLKGEKGDDHIDGGAGNDTLSGGAGNDRLYASTGHDTLYGGSGNDFLAGWAGDDRMLGGFGNDRMFGDDGSDYMRGSYGDDIMWGESSRADLNRQFKGGNDDMAGGYGNDEIHGGKGNDRLAGESGHDRLYGDTGDDHMSGGTGNDSLFGGSGNDKLYADDGDDTLHGGSGNDFLAGWDGNDTINGGSGNDTMYGDDGSDIMTGGFGNDVMWGESNNPIFNAQSKGGDDSISGGFGNDEIHGGKGNDQLNGGSGNDTVIGDEGNDVLLGYSGDDILLGGRGADKFVFSSARHGLDRIVDFSSLQGDKIQIDASRFGGGLAQGVLLAGQFVLGSIAADASDRFIYNRSSGALSFDIDGAGGAKAVQFATLAGNTTLSHTDFTFV